MASRRPSAPAAPPPRFELRVRRHAALGDPVRLAIVDDLCRSDRTPSDLARRLGIAGNLLAHHLDVLEAVGLVERRRSSGDGRRRYVRVRPDALDPGLGPEPIVGPHLFVCTANSARSRLAAALWTQITGRRATSAGTRPAGAVHPGAVAAARRAGIPIDVRRPRRIGSGVAGTVVTVCDQAHEELGAAAGWRHWSVPDPVAAGDDAAFDAVVDELRRRIELVATDGGVR